MSISDSKHHGFQFHLLSKLYYSHLVKGMEEYGLSRGFLMLLRIAEEEGNISQNDLSREFLIDKVSTNRTTKYLLEQGLISKNECPKDRRKGLLSLTKEGHDLIPKIKKTLIKTNHWFMADLSSQEQKQLTDLLLKLKTTCTKDLD